MKLIIEIELGNDAMQTPEDVKQCLNNSLNGHTPYVVGELAKLYDINGNCVGSWRVREKLPCE